MSGGRSFGADLGSWPGKGVAQMRRLTAGSESWVTCDIRDTDISVVWHGSPALKGRGEVVGEIHRGRAVFEIKREVNEAGIPELIACEKLGAGGGMAEQYLAPDWGTLVQVLLESV